MLRAARSMCTRCAAVPFSLEAEGSHLGAIVDSAWVQHAQHTHSRVRHSSGGEIALA